VSTAPPSVARPGLAPHRWSLSRSRRRTPQWWLQRATLLGCYVVLMLAQLLQQRTTTTFDTKLDLFVDPGRFLGQNLSLWTSRLGMGSLQNQAYGYLFPIGPVFVLAHAVALPPWLWERLWSGLLSVIAFEGTRRLARAWGGVGWRGALVAGAGYVLAPRFLSEIGVLTGELLPTVLLPWVVLPLVRARRRQLAWPFAVAVSGLLVATMGGVNAAEVLAVLPLPLVLLVTAALNRQLPWRALGAWVAAVVVGCAWWLGPLGLLGRFSPPFLDYIESSANTTAVLGWVNATRGADNWVGYLAVGGHAWWPAGFALDTTPWLVVVTALVAALSLCGLIGSGARDRAPLLVSLAIGLTCLIAAHGGAAGGLVASPLRGLLDGAMAPLRNVHKVDPLIRLPMALGLGWAAHETRVWWLARLRRRSPVAALGRPTVVAATVVGCVTAVVLAASAQPVAAQQLRQLPGWSALPGPWQAAAEAMDALPPSSRVLVAPASGMGLQVWGWTIDEPVQPLTTEAWATRGQAPLVPGGAARWLDSIEAALASGHGSAALAPALARGGFTDVLLRTDLDPDASDAPPPVDVASALATSPGLLLLQSFGAPPGSAGPFQLWSVVAPTAGAATGDRPHVTPESMVRTVQGGPEAIVPLLADHVLLPDQPVELTGPRTTADIVTDTLQRREQGFGRVNQAVSSIMTATDPWQSVRAAHDYPAFPGQADTVARYPGFTSLTATSSGGFVDIVGPVRPDEGPYSAFDGDASTAWVSAPYSAPVGQGVSVALRRPAVLGTVAVALWRAPGDPVVTAVRVSTDEGSSIAPVPTGARSVTVPLPAGATRQVSVAVAGVLADTGAGQVGFVDVRLPGVDQSRTLVVPGAAGPSSTLAFGSAGPLRACTYPDRVCDAARAEPAEEAAGLDRTFRLTGAGSWHLQLGAVARPSEATEQLLAPVGRGF
jgi:arabinofuranan 3-O-arabinosyltransferase